MLIQPLAGGRDRDPGHRSTTADRHGPKPNSRQAARATPTPANNERGAELCKQFSRLRGCGEDVRDRCTQTWIVVVELMLMFVDSRFVSLPPNTLNEKLQRQMQDLDGDVDKLNQRLLYLETTQKNSREHIEKILRAN